MGGTQVCIAGEGEAAGAQSKLHMANCDVTLICLCGVGLSKGAQDAASNVGMIIINK